MYQVIAMFHAFRDAQVKPFYIAKTYKSIRRAETFIQGQKNHPKFYFEIKKIEA